MSEGFTLGRQQRLKSRKRIDELFREGRSFHFYPLRAVYLPVAAATDEPLKFGVTVSTRYFKRAVHRNRMKRRIREAWRLNRASLEGRALHVFFVYTGKELCEYTLINEKMLQAIRKLEELTRP